MNFDEFLKILGEFGTYQKQRYALICIVAFYSVLSTLGIVFYGAEPNHHCRIPTSQVDHVTTVYGNLSQEELLELFVPYTEEGKRSSCEIYHFDGSVNFTHITIRRNNSLYTTLDENANKDIITVNYTVYAAQDMLWNKTSEDGRKTHTCAGQRVYSKDIYESTIVSEFDLSCENAWQLSMCNSIFFGGKLVATLLAGVFSDRFGRRKLFLISIIILTASGMLLALSPNMVVFSILYIIQGASDACMYAALYTMGLEFVGPSKRKITGMFMSICFGLGHSLLALEAYLLPNWRHLALVASSPGLICICFWFFFSESVRWLLARGRETEAKKIIAKVARVNKVEIDDEILQRLFKEGDEEKQTTTHTPIDLFRSWNRAKLAVIIPLCWFSVDMSYYGLALHAEGLGGNIYLNFALLGAADIPAQIVAMLILDKIGRRKIILATLCIGGVACIVSGLLPEDFQWLTIAMALVGKMFISTGGDVIQMMGAELYPTVIRQMAVGFFISVGRFGAVLAPQTLALGRLYRPFPFLIWGSLTVISAFLALLLPETLGKPLPQTLEAWDLGLDHGSLDVADDECVDADTDDQMRDMPTDDHMTDTPIDGHMADTPIDGSDKSLDGEMERGQLELKTLQT